MKVDKPAQEHDETYMPGEFGENYRFLSTLITCKERNNCAAEGLDELLGEQFRRIRGKLNRRQMSILNQYLKGGEGQDEESVAPPVPAELEASIRIRKRSTWLPWEAEAIRKIERWRGDIDLIKRCWTQELPKVPKSKSLPEIPGSPVDSRGTQ
ncbi:MAG: hypothetical protein RDU20_07505 [Desulfomonilaceae bacterium]|nr:hypothetical protein [Desulfomonilaceae bacterium]